MEEKQKKLIQQLSNFFNGDKTRIKLLAENCKAIGFPLNVEKNLDAIAQEPEHFTLLITYSDLGLLEKLTKSLKILQQK